MKKELIGIIICILLTSVAVAPVINALTNEINETKEPPQPAPWPPYDKELICGFGRISNLQHGYNEWEPYYSFDCENVICITGDLRFHHYTNDEKLYVTGPYVGIITDNFIFVLLP